MTNLDDTSVRLLQAMADVRVISDTLLPENGRASLRASCCAVARRMLTELPFCADPRLLRLLDLSDVGSYGQVYEATYAALEADTIDVEETCYAAWHALRAVFDAVEVGLPSGSAWSSIRHATRCLSHAVRAAVAAGDVGAAQELVLFADATLRAGGVS